RDHRRRRLVRLDGDRAARSELAAAAREGPLRRASRVPPDPRLLPGRPDARTRPPRRDAYRLGRTRDVSARPGLALTCGLRPAALPRDPALPAAPAARGERAL